MAEHSLLTRISATCLVIASVLSAPACGHSARPVTTPSAAVAAVPTLPPVPLVDGPLVVRVVYPPAGATIQSRDSNFIFGTVGSGKATIAINGVAVPVVPNGSFIAYLPVPPAATPQYSIVATRGADTARVLHPVKLLPPRPVLPSP